MIEYDPGTTKKARGGSASSYRIGEAAGSGLLKGAEEIANLYGLLPYLTDEKYRFGFAPEFEPRSAVERALYTGGRYLPDIVPFGGGTALARVGIRAALKGGALKRSPDLVKRLTRTTPAQSLKLGAYSEVGGALGAGTASAVAPDSALAEFIGALGGGTAGGIVGLRKLDIPTDASEEAKTALSDFRREIGQGTPKGIEDSPGGMRMGERLKGLFVDYQSWADGVTEAIFKGKLPKDRKGITDFLQSTGAASVSKAQRAALDFRDFVLTPITVGREGRFLGTLAKWGFIGKGKVHKKDYEDLDVLISLENKISRLEAAEKIIPDLQKNKLEIASLESRLNMNPGEKLADVGGGPLMERLRKHRNDLAEGKKELKRLTGTGEYLKEKQKALGTMGRFGGKEGQIVTKQDAIKAMDDLKQEVVKRGGNWEGIVKARDNYEEGMKGALKKLFDEGVLTEHHYKDLVGRGLYAPMHFSKRFQKAYKDKLSRGELGGKKLWEGYKGSTDTDAIIRSPLEAGNAYIQKTEMFLIQNRRNRELSEFYSKAVKEANNPEGVDKIIKFDVPVDKSVDGMTKFFYRERGGEQKAFALADEYADFLKTASKHDAEHLVSVAAKAGQMFRLGATGANFAFIIPNFMADAMRATFISAAGPTNPVDFLRFSVAHYGALKSSAKANFLGKWDETYWDAYHAGVLNSTLTRGLAPEGSIESLAKKGLVKNTLSKVPQFTNTLEEMWILAGVQRLKEASPLLEGKNFKKLMGKEGLTSLDSREALKALNELRIEVRRYAGSPDFARGGSLFKGKRLENLNLMFMFTNARIQGIASDWDRLTVPFRKNRLGNNISPEDIVKANKAVASISQFVGIPTAALMGYNLWDKESRDNYFKIPEWEREKYWMIPIAGKFFENEQGDMVQEYLRIPKRGPFQLFSNAIEQSIIQFIAPHVGEGISEKDRKSFGEWLTGLLDNVFQEVSPVEIGGETATERIESVASGLNPLFRVPLETTANRNFWAHRPIIPEYVRAPGGRAVKAKYLKAHQVYKEGTNELYKGLSAFAGSKGIEVTPLKIQHFIEGYTGNLVAQLFPSSNRKTLKKMFNVQKIPVVGKVVQRFQRSAYIDKSREFKKLREALGKQEFDNWANNEFASRFIDAMYDPDSRTTPAEKEAILSDYRSNADFQREVALVLKQMQLGRTSLDNMVMRLSIRGGRRARLMASILKDLSEEDRNIRWNDWAQKGMLENKLIQGQVNYYMGQP